MEDLKCKMAEGLNKKADELDRRAEESFERCDTDGFLTQWADSITAQLHRAEADIIERGGLWNFDGLFDLDGNRVRAKLISVYDRYKRRHVNKWCFCDKNGRPTGEFMTSHLLPKNLAKKGFTERQELAPAKAVILGSGYGLSGSAWVARVRVDKGYPEDAVSV